MTGSRIKNLTTVSALVALALLPTVAANEVADAVRPSQTPPGRDHAVQRLWQRHKVINLLLARQLLMERYDADNNGILDDSEKEKLLADADKAREQARAKIIARYDRDGDGKLSREEIDLMKKATRRGGSSDEKILPPMHNYHRLRKHDGKKDGEKTEKGKDVRVRVVTRHAGRERFDIRPSVFLLMQKLIIDKYDANRNGRLDPEEREQLRNDGQIIYQRKCRELLGRYDLDNNGRLDDDERRAAQESRSRRKEADAANPGGLRFDDIDRFIRESFEEELMEMLRDDSDK